VKDGVARMMHQGMLSAGLEVPSVPYSVVYHIEIAALFATLIALGPLVSMFRAGAIRRQQEFGLVDLPA
jgi:BCD family chlorophyll transporter-like MFS transporter